MTVIIRMIIAYVLYFYHILIHNSLQASIRRIVCFGGIKYGRKSAEDYFHP